MRYARIAACLAIATVLLVSGGCATSRTQMIIDSLLEEVKRNPDNPDLHAKLARSYLIRHEETKNPAFLYVAANELKEVIRLKPDLHWGHCTLSLVYQVQGKDDLALFEAKEAVRLDPDCPSSRKSLGMLYGKKSYSEEACYDDEMTDLAIKEFKEAVRLNPDDSALHTWLGTLYGRKGLYDVSVFERKESLKLSKSADNHSLLGLALFQRGDYAGAIEEYEQALRLNPSFVEMHLSIAWVYMVSGKYEDSLAELGTYQKLSRWTMPPDSAVHRYVAMRLTGKNDEAVKTLEEYTAAFKGKGWELDALKYYLGKASEADLLGKARNKCDRAAISYFIGYDYFLKGDRQKAAEHFQATVDTNTFGFSIHRAASAMLEALRKDGVTGPATKVDNRR